MRNEEQRLRVALQILLQPFDHLHIEMVSRLVENEKIGICDQHRGQSHTLSLTSGKQAHRFVEFIDLELRENLLGAQLNVVPFFIGVKGFGVRLQLSTFFGDE